MKGRVQQPNLRAALSVRVVLRYGHTHPTGDAPYGSKSMPPVISHTAVTRPRTACLPAIAARRPVVHVSPSRPGAGHGHTSVTALPGHETL